MFFTVCHFKYFDSYTGKKIHTSHEPAMSTVLRHPPFHDLLQQECICSWTPDYPEFKVSQAAVAES